LDGYLHQYNYERAHQGRNMNGRTPYQAFKEGLPKKKSPAKKALPEAAGRPAPAKGGCVR